MLDQKTRKKKSVSLKSRIPFLGLSSAIQSLPMGNSNLIGVDGWMYGLEKVPVIMEIAVLPQNLFKEVKPSGYLGDISVTATYTLTSKTKLRLDLEAVLENKRTLHRLLYRNPPIKSTEVSNERALNTWFEVSRY
ncbi:hypothetical protein Tco_1005352 [Tanacetum coccineum]|uniref:Uncharacterized protein n=1 Tax=Tanacetum coccineum TaxID=301880 RepID=A0ABQ5FFP6_9ASTR